MPKKYGNHERAALFVLMRENREMRNTELTKIGIKLGPTGRAELNKAGLLHSRMEKRQYLHRITDQGVDWCEEELATVDPPAGSGPLVREVFGVLRRAVPLLRQHGIRVSEVLHPADLESLIRAAYVDLSTKPQDWVRLANLRSRLNGAGKEEVDGVLLEMARTGDVHLAPDSNRKTLTDADHTAAIRIGPEDKHLIVIEES
ncbi:hypothetical protein AB0G02_01675 [Actinosynnema sp. NPDC023658]|uniref:hypothetical protein n=1 Tax=Actinosynnema sp. NPDC023658 TaxID=3155465 RepID=UPI0033E31F53